MDTPPSNQEDETMECQSENCQTITKGKSSWSLPHASSSRSLLHQSSQRMKKEYSESVKCEERGQHMSTRRNELGSVSYHGSPTSSTKHGSSSCRVPGRHKSSDNIEFSNVCRNDDLGTAMLHGKLSISRIRKSQWNLNNSKERSSKSDRRSNMKHAMSRENIKRPEEYGPGGGSNASISTLSRHGRHRPKKGDNIIVKEDETDSDGDSFAEETPRGFKKTNSLTSPACHDLLVLLREQKSININDFHDKENHCILHFLLYQHKLGIDLLDLQNSIDHDIMMNGAEALHCPVPPLYVDPA